MLNPIGALEIGRSHRSAGAVDQGEDPGLLGHFSHPAFCDCDCETSGANHLPGAAELSVGDLGVVRNFQVGRKHVLCEPVGGNIEIREAVLFKDDSIVPFARLEDVVEGELDTAETDIEELLVEALATLMPFSEFDIVTQSWEFDLPTLAKLPTSTVQSLHKRLMKRGLDNIDASCTILNVCPHQFRSSTIKFFFDDAKFTPIDSTERFDVINEGTPKEFRMALAKRDDFDDSLLTPDDIWKDDSAALLVRFLKSPQVNSEMKEAIARLENERDRPRKTVLDAYESAVATSVGVGL